MNNPKGDEMTVTTQKLENYLRGLAKRRKDSKVTADDAHRFLDRSGIPTTGRTRYINSVLNRHNDEISPAGTVSSERPAARGRAITAWQWSF